MVSFEEFKKLEIIVAQIKEVQDHPDADRLLVLKVDTGSEEKQLVAGIKMSYLNKEELVGRKIVVINNLAPAVIRGVESQGMLLAAGDANGVALLTPEKDLPLGCTIR